MKIVRCYLVKLSRCVAIITETSFRKMKILLGYFLLGFNVCNAKYYIGISVI